MFFTSDTDRTASLHRCCPQLFSYHTVLYIGARSERFDYGEEFKAANYKITILEAFHDNVLYLNQLPWIANVLEGDIRTYNFSSTYDVVFWWHGPEHIYDNELESTVHKIECIATKLVVLGCPWGIFLQGSAYGNPFENHVAYLDYEIFERLGYTVECLGQKDAYGSNITSVKML